MKGIHKTPSNSLVLFNTTATGQGGGGRGLREAPRQRLNGLTTFQVETNLIRTISGEQQI